MEQARARPWHGALAAALLATIAAPGIAPGQCPNNCSGNGTCVPAPKLRRFQCECHAGWTGQSCSQRLSARAKAKAEEPPIILEEAEPNDGVDVTVRSGGVRQLDEITRDQWNKLSGYERKLLTDLGWKEATWNTKESPRTVWPAAMHRPYKGLTPVEQAAVRAFGLTPADWNAGRHLALLMHPAR